jgi:NAD(P)-dependent dehydrogenase (short-subunit alcohol dehydrogenase family)
MRNPEGSAELLQAIEEGLPIKVFAMDVNSDESVKKTIAAIQAETPVDVLVNNAGIERKGSVEELGLSVFREIMETNYFGAIRCIQAVMPQMRRRMSGCIINITSIAGRIACSPFAPYTASKYALEALTEALAQEAKMFNIRTAIVEPGIIDTVMTQVLSKTVNASHYPQPRRWAGLVGAALEKPVSPVLVGQKILEIIESNTWILRHPVGPDAQPFLQWRSSMTDEQWVDWGSADDETWYKSIERDFGLNARSRAAGAD